MKIVRASVTIVAIVAALGSAGAVSDGQYDPARMHCSGAADNYTAEDTVEPGCYTMAMTLFDGTGHEYVGWGIQQTVEGESPSRVDVWVDPGDGTKTTLILTRDEAPRSEESPGTPADTSNGLHLYFGADDNLDTGEHDSSPQINNGPSDGGAIVVDVDPATASAWLDALAAMDAATILTHPLPVGGTGFGFCADGICVALTTERRVAFRGGNADLSRDVFDYEGKEWDPESCAGPSDGPADCGGVPLSTWNAREGVVYTEPGLQIFEDPDAQGSPVGPYPLPALYVGTCGVVIGGGDLAFHASPVTNAAGQLEIRTAC